VEISVPLQLSVGAHTYKVMFNQIVYDDGHDATVSHKLQEIWIAPDMPDSRKVVSLIHEFLHVVCNVQRVERIDENDMDRISEGLASLFAQLGITLDWSNVPTLEVKR